MSRGLNSFTFTELLHSLDDNSGGVDLGGVFFLDSHINYVCGNCIYSSTDTLQHEKELVNK